MFLLHSVLRFSKIKFIGSHSSHALHTQSEYLFPFSLYFCQDVLFIVTEQQGSVLSEYDFVCNVLSCPSVHLNTILFAMFCLIQCAPRSFMHDSANQHTSLSETTKENIELPGPLIF
jgi:hypothetical protein